jgi:hypothetical protein
VKKIPIIITAYCDGDSSEIKIRMAEKLCEELSKTGHYICLASHSIMPASVQKHCNAYIYDSDNDFHINGIPETDRTHGMAEIKSIHNAVNYLERFGFTEFFKLTYDCDPYLPYGVMIERAQWVIENYNKSMVCSGWGNQETIAALLFYSKIDFFRKITSLDTPEVWKSCFEVSWYNNAKNLGATDQIFQSHIRLYDDYLGFAIKDYSHQGGTEMEYYPY